jgi:hypothetical protein
MVETSAAAGAESIVLLLEVVVVAAAVEVVLGVTTELDAQLTVVVDILSSAILVAEFRRKNPSTSTRVELCHTRSHAKMTVTRHRFLAAKTTFDIVVVTFGVVVIFQKNSDKKARKARYRIALWIGDKTLATVLPTGLC